MDISDEHKFALQKLFEISFVDDGVWPVFSEAEHIVAKTKEAIEILDKVCSCFGLVVNYKKGKTMVMIKFSSRGRRPVQCIIWSKQPGQKSRKKAISNSVLKNG